MSGWPNASVVLRPEAIRERLLRLEQVVSRLQQLCVLGGRELREDFRSAWTVERGLQLAAEIVFDVGNHILSADFAITAQDYEDIITQLAAQRVLDPALRERRVDWAGSVTSSSTVIWRSTPIASRGCCRARRRISRTSSAPSADGCLPPRLESIDA